MKSLVCVLVLAGAALALGCSETATSGWKDTSGAGGNDAGAPVEDGGGQGTDGPMMEDDGPMTMGDGGMEMDGGMMGMGGNGMDSGMDAGVADDVGQSGDAGGVQKAAGAACTAAGECPAGGSGTVACETTWPDGYCLVADCAQHGHDCPLDAQPGGGKCVDFDGAKCLAVCASKADCRTGYDCVAQPDTAGHGSFEVCVPQ